MLEKITDPKDVILKEGHVPIRHRYTPGVAGEAFFRALKEDGDFIASRCPECGRVYCPPRLFCERDFAELAANEKVGPEGTLESFSVGYVGVEGEPLDQPVAIGLVRLDGADTVLMHRVIDADELEIGQRVVAVLLPASKRVGSINDIRGFKPTS